MYHKDMGKNSGLTLTEILIVMAIIAVLAIISIAIFNPLDQIKKGWDAKSKRDLAEMRRIFEDFYNDKGCYPKVNQICYDPPSSPSNDGTYRCHICGKIRTPDAIKPYISELPCNPEYPKKKYLYQVDNNSCPTLYRIYTILGIETDPIINNVGCIQDSCGPPYPYIYNYGVASPNIDLQRSNNFFCAYYNSSTGLYDCNSCINYSSCLTNCPIKNRVYPDFQGCCQGSTPNSCGNTFRYCLDSYGNCNACGNLPECNTNPGCALFGSPPKKKIYRDSNCTIP